MANRYNGEKNNRYSFDGNAAYDLSNFEVQRPQPIYEPKPKRMPKLELVDQKKTMTSSQLRAEERAGLLKSIKIMTIATVLFIMLGAVLFGETQKNELTREISKTQSQLKIEESENTRLNMILNSLVSMDKIEQYATEQLGMIKMGKSQIEYIDVSETEKAKSEESETREDTLSKENQSTTSANNDEKVKE